MWTVRLPASLNIKKLQGVELDMNNSTSLATFSANNIDYGFTNGDVAENEQFRLLLREDDLLEPHARPFDRHVNVTAAIGERLDTELAPRLETAPTPADGIRRSYSHVPQATGLKRRWMPPGGGSVPATAAGSKRKEAPAENMNGIKDHAATGGSKASKSAEHDSPASKRSKVDESHMNGDHSSSKKKSKKERKKEKKAKKKKAKKEHKK